MSTVPRDPAPSITTLSRREVYRNHWMRVYEDKILRSNGQEGVYGVVEKDPSAIILPIDGDRIWLVGQFRYPVQQFAWELPQGGWEEEVADPEELARGELREETGLEATRMDYLGYNWIAYGYTRQPQHVFLATGLTESETDRDDEEHDLQVRSFSIDEFEEMMLCGQIRDNCTLAAWALYLMKKARQA